MSLRRHFLAWDRPLLPQAVAHLAETWTGDGPLDLSAVLAIVPTRQSGRRLREALAARAAARGQAVFPPRVLTPEALLALGVAGPAATKLDALFAWTAVLREADLAELPDVFPVAPPTRSFAWALRLAQQFSRLQTQLAEGGLRIADVPGRAGDADDFPETARWEQLAELERRHDAALRARGLVSPIAAELAWAVASVPPPGVARVVLLAAPDPLPRVAGVLRLWAQALPVEVMVFAPEGEAEAFDEFGRPRPEAWAKRPLVLPAFDQRVHLCADPAAQAAMIARAVVAYGQPEGVVALGVADPEVTPLLGDELAHAGVSTFDPEGKLWREGGFYQLLAALAALAREPSFAAVAALARCPDLLVALESSMRGFSVGGWLSGLDDLQAGHLPPTLVEAQRHARGARRPEVARGLDFLAQLHADLTTGRFPENARVALGRIFASRRLDLSRSAEARLAAAAAAWNEVLTEVGAAAERFGALDTAEGWELALGLFGDGRSGREQPPGGLELQGWLELLWEDAPHLLVAGVNDGFVPDAIVGDVFLPERLRERLGLKTNAARFARDAYLLQALAAARRGDGGRIDLLYGKTSAAGDPLRPSRLLLACPDAELPGRVARLFRAVETGRPAPAWRRAWKLAPRLVSPPPRVAVTGLRAWLECPFRFYLRRVLRMEPVDPAKAELDVLDFGTLCHAAFEALGRDPAMRASTDAALLRDFLVAELERAAAERFGRELSLPLLVQLESARQRLGRLAEVQAEVRAAGWLIEEVERPFEIDVAGLTVSGKIDRIERHETTGVRRVIDYKTSDRAAEPREAHLRAPRRAETAPDFARVIVDGREHVWTDLQLPLYLRVVAPQGAPVEGAYFNLPKAVGETRLSPWPGYTPELAESAWRCAEGVAEAIRAGRFWPPNETIRPERDDFAALFHHGAADSIAWGEAAR